MNDSNRFRGQLRHYHRAGANPTHSWDEWADGDGKSSRNWRKVWKIAGLIVGLLALGGIIYGLINALQ